MRYLQVPSPEFTICLNRTPLDKLDGMLRNFFVPHMVETYIKSEDPALREISKVEYQGIDLIAGGINYKLPFSATPIFNLGYLESRVIEEAVPSKTDVLVGYVNHIGTMVTKAVRQDKEVDLVRISYEVHSCSKGIRTVYHVTDTYVEGDIPPPVCEFVSKMI